MEKIANTEEKKKLLYVCSTVAKPCCCMGSFLEGFFGMTRMHDGLLTVTLMHLCVCMCVCVCLYFQQVVINFQWLKHTHTHTHTHARTR